MTPKRILAVVALGLIVLGLFFAIPLWIAVLILAVAEML